MRLFFRKYNVIAIKNLSKSFTSSVHAHLKDNLGASNFTSFSYLNNQLFPWKNLTEFSKNLKSWIVYNENGLIALNKPYGIKVYKHEEKTSKPPLSVHSLIPDCTYTIEEALPILKQDLDITNLIILKSPEKYSSGLILLATNEKVSAQVKKSFNIAKFQKIPHLIHWVMTSGYPVVDQRKEKVGIKFVELEDKKIRQPIIVTDVSKRSCKLKKVYSVLVEYKLLDLNKDLSTSLLEIASSSVSYYFIRLYASSRAASILGDLMFSSRMNRLLGIPTKIALHNALAADIQPLPASICKQLNLPMGRKGHLMMPTMLHFHSVLLPSFQGKDLKLCAEPPEYFKCTMAKLNLSSNVSAMQ